MYWKVTRHNKATTCKKDTPTYPPALLQPPSISLSYKGSRHTALCMEEALRTLINCLLYNPATRTFDFSLLSNDIQEKCKQNNPAFYTFIQRYNNPCAPEFYKASAQEWLALVSELPSIEYHSKNFELYGGNQILKVICHLFGITDTKSYKELAEKLSTQERTVVLEQQKDAANLSFVLQNFTFKVGTAHFNREHGYFHFFSSSINSTTREFIEEAYTRHIANDEHHYRTLYCNDVKNMPLDAFKQGIEELTPAELVRFVSYSHNILLHFAEQEKNDHLLYVLKHPTVKNSQLYFNDFLLNIVKTGNEQVARFMFKNMKIDRTYTQPQSSATFFEIACQNKKHFSLEFIKALLKAHPQALNMCMNPVRSCLFHAAVAHNRPLMNFLLEKGAYPNSQNYMTDESTILHILGKDIISYSEEILILIRSGKCDLSLQNNEGKTALEIMRAHTSFDNLTKLHEIEAAIRLTEQC